jgi:plastocyanin
MKAIALLLVLVASSYCALVEIIATASPRQFSPFSTTINIGDTVLWSNIGTHNVAQVSSSTNNTYNGGFRSGNARTVSNYTILFDANYVGKTSVFYYVCEPHVVAYGMRGEIVIRGAEATTTTTTTVPTTATTAATTTSTPTSVQYTEVVTTTNSNVAGNSSLLPIKSNSTILALYTSTGVNSTATVGFSSSPSTTPVTGAMMKISVSVLSASATISVTAANKGSKTFQISTVGQQSLDVSSLFTSRRSQAVPSSLSLSVLTAGVSIAISSQVSIALAYDSMNQATNPPPDGRGSNIGLIIGVVIGVLVGMAATLTVIVIVLLIVMRQRRKTIQVHTAQADKYRLEYDQHTQPTYEITIQHD